MTRALVPLLLLVLLCGAFAGQAAWRYRSADPGVSADWSATEILLQEAGLRPEHIESTLLAIGRGGASGLIVRANGADLTREEVDAVSAFAQNGGRVIVLAETALAARFGMEVAPVAIHSTTGGVLRAEGVGGPLLPAARPLLGAGDPILSTETASFVDADGDGRASATDVAGPFTVGRRTPEGGVIVISSADLLEPASLEDAATRAYARDLFATHFPAGAIVALDATRARDDAPLRDAIVAASIDASHVAWLRVVVVAVSAAASGTAWLVLRPSTAPMKTDERVPLAERGS
ncbi:MAG: DUF4350 domain-containing protein [Candidatus Thermoplasmatota archaeon]